MDQPVTMSTVCPDCQGSTVVVTNCAIVSLDPGGHPGPASTVGVPKPCTTCGGTGSLPGFVPPV